MPLRWLAYVWISLLVAGAHSLASGLLGLVAYRLLGGGSGEPYHSIVFTVFGLLSLAVAYAIATLPKPELSREEAFLVGVLVWVSTPLVSAIPLSLALRIHYVDALFESVSGWTTTGLTLMTGEYSSLGGFLPSPEELPPSVQFWRSLSQWMGGLGILALTAYLLAGHRLSIAYLYMVEGRFQRISSNIYVAVRELSAVYIAFTIAIAIALYVAGMSFYDSIHHAMTSIATGGFSTHRDSVGFYGSTLVHVVVLAAILTGATSFLDLYYLLRLKLRKLLESVELKALLTVCSIAVALTTALWLVDPLTRSEFPSLFALVFSSISALATAGFTVSDISRADEAYKFLAITLMLVGGSAFSTAGGIKLLRVVVVAKSISWEIESSLKPQSYVKPKRVGAYALDDALLRRTLVIVALYVASVPLFATLIWLSLGGTVDYIDAMFESASAISGTGLSVGVARANSPLEVKALLCLAMLLGRLEILAFLAALAALASRLSKRTPLRAGSLRSLLSRV
ncbi:MAG: potassium transporter TrkG [Acidilobaceae archaeon]